MKTWSHEEAISQFALIFDAALRDGPQRVERPGGGAVIVASEKKSETTATGATNFGKHLTKFPIEPEDFSKE